VCFLRVPFFFREREREKKTKIIITLEKSLDHLEKRHEKQKKKGRK